MFKTTNTLKQVNVKPVVKIQSTVNPPEKPTYIEWFAYIKKEANKNLEVKK